MVKVLAAILLALVSGAASAETLRLVTEEYPPYAFRQGDRLEGTSVDQIELMMKATGMDYTLEAMPWARALTLSQTRPMHCAVTTAHDAERHDKFKWVEPLFSGRTLLIRKTGAAISAGSIKDATRYSVGTTRGEFTVGLLQSKGFERIDLASDFSITFRKLMLGRIDMMPIAEEHFYKLRADGERVERVLVLSEQTYSLACNKSVPDATIARLQSALDALIADGTQAAIFRRYGLRTE